MRGQHQAPSQPGSTSWISLRKNYRSTSLPRVRLTPRSGRGGNVEDSPSLISSTTTTGVRSWAKQFLSGVSPSRSTNHSPQKTSGMTTVRRRTPVLTLTLLKMDEQLTPYCQYLSDPSQQNIRAACDLLSRTIAVASSSSPPKSSATSLFSTSPKNNSSSSRSPIRSWLSGAYSSPPSNYMDSPPTILSTHSDLALEGEWEKFTMPLLLLAGAEALFASMLHIQNSTDGVDEVLQGLYQRIIKDLFFVKETLCHPFLMTGEKEENIISGTTSSALKLYKERALSVAKTLGSLQHLAEIRCRLIPLHVSLFREHNFGELQIFLQEKVLPSLSSTEASPPNKALSILNALKQQVEGWKYLMETAHWLERCRFTETILACQKTKLRLCPNSRTVMQMWLKTTLSSLLTILPIIFDRIQAFAKPLYGISTFDQPAATTVNIKKVKEFFSKQPHNNVAVTIVLDATATGNLQIERGFSLVPSSDEDVLLQEESELELARLRYPAIFLRTNNDSTSHSSYRVDGSPSVNKSTTLCSTSSFAEHYKRWSSTDGSSDKPALMSSDEPSLEPKEYNILEYQGSSWPHSDWNHLVNCLTLSEEEFMPSTTTPRSDKGFFKFLKSSSFTNLLDTNNEAEPDASPLLKSTCFKRSTEQSKFCVSPLSQFAWLVVMTTKEETPSSSNPVWHHHHRRRGSNLQDDIEDFCSSLARALRVGDWFDSKMIPPMHSMLVPLLAQITSSNRNNDWTDSRAQEFLQSLKVAFELRALAGGDSPARSPMVEPLQESYSQRFTRYEKSPSLQPWRKSRRVTSMEKSAMTFFLGAELVPTFLFCSQTKKEST